MNRQQLLDEIIEMFARWRVHVGSAVRLNLTGANIHSETLLLRVLNAAHGFELKNANAVVSNHPFVDLIDRESRVAVQVTSTPDGRKIKKTLEGIAAALADEDKRELLQHYDRFVVYVLTKKQRRYSVKVPAGINFDFKDDVWDADHLLAHLTTSASVETLERVHRELRAEFPRSSPGEAALARRRMATWTGIAASIASWGERLVLDSDDLAPDTDTHPAPTIDALYVEPTARTDSAEGPVLGVIREALQRHIMVVVTADFGHGKSLTARALARDLASDWLGSEPGTGTFPVFIKCVRDFVASPYDHDSAVRHALRHACIEALDEHRPVSDTAFALPQADAALFILDGLDEVGLSRKETQRTLRTLHAALSDRQRALVLCRPSSVDKHVIPSGTCQLHILPFQMPDQIDDWLARWNGLGRGAVGRTELEGAGLIELATVPILLFMMASVWDELAGEGGITRSRLYEMFVRQCARGKHVADEDNHEAIALTSEILRQALAVSGVRHGVETGLDAMLWLMGRLAWEQCRQRYAGREQRTEDVLRSLVSTELGITGRTDQESVVSSALLALQLAPGSPDEEPMLGHRSFNEFLVARFWSQQFGRLLPAGVPASADVAKELSGGRISQIDSASFPFLMEIVLADRSDQAQDALARWTEAEVLDPSLDTSCAEGLAGDGRSPLREAALAIRNRLVDRPPMVVPESFVRSLLAWAVARDINLRLVAPDAALSAASLPGSRLLFAQLPGADLGGADLTGSDLRGAILPEAMLDGANVSHCNLSPWTSGSTYFSAVLRKASCRKTKLERADLSLMEAREADFTGADLRAAQLVAADLRNTKMQHACLNGADARQAALRGADLQSASLRAVDFRAADLREARLVAAQLQGSCFSGAKLGGADLSRAIMWGFPFGGTPEDPVEITANEFRPAMFVGADCVGTCFRGVDARGVSFRRADLRRADFRGADLRGAVLEESKLDGALCDGLTQWDGGVPAGCFLIAPNTDLAGAALRGADLGSCKLEGACLDGAKLDGTNLGSGDCRRTSFIGASLAGANLHMASLENANLQDCDLAEATLHLADLTDTNLRGADFTGTQLGGTKLHGAVYDDETRWPEGFDPQRSGATRLEIGEE